MRRATLLLSCFLFASLNGCVTRVAMKSDFWNNRSAKIGVVLAPYPTGAAHKSGAQGVLDMAINAALSAEMKRYLQGVQPLEFNDIQHQFSAQLKSMGIEAKTLPEPIDLKAYQTFEGTGPGKMFKQDLRPLASKENIDFIVILSITRFGTIRNYYGFVPTEKPRALCDVKGQMINLATNELVWQAATTEIQARTTVEGKWDQPPDYPNLTASLWTAVKKGKTFLFEEFFAQAVAPQK